MSDPIPRRPRSFVNPIVRGWNYFGRFYFYKSWVTVVFKRL